MSVFYDYVHTNVSSEIHDGRTRKSSPLHAYTARYIHSVGCDGGTVMCIALLGIFEQNTRGLYDGYTFMENTGKIQSVLFLSTGCLQAYTRNDKTPDKIEEVKWTVLNYYFYVMIENSRPSVENTGN